ncbi:MAG: hypothetical protein NTY53_21650 [Kiritimatiellaeota bacterium]|nr:hypothetical protein [Kiritimatiellota bacterium]
MQMMKWMAVGLVVTMLGGVAVAKTVPPPPPKKAAKTTTTKEADAGEKMEFKDIPTLQDGPGKGYYAIVQTKFYDALVVASNLTIQLFPKDKGERIDKPIICDNRFVYTPQQNETLPKDLMAFTGVRNMAPPAVNPPKIVITAVSDSGTMLIQTWKFSEGKIEVEDHLKGFDQNAPPTMRTYFKFPQTHKFTPNIEKADREKAMAGYLYTIRGGKSENALKTMKLTYASKPEGISVGDSIENQGPWGDRKITIKRKAGKGSVNYGGAWNKFPYDGLEFCFGTRADPKTKKLDVQGCEIKIE